MKLNLIEIRQFIRSILTENLVCENLDDADNWENFDWDSLDRYTIDDNFYLYKDGKRHYSSTSKNDLIDYLSRYRPELLKHFGFLAPRKKVHYGTITLYRGIGHNEGNNFYSPSKEFAMEFTRSNRESELKIIQAQAHRIYKHNPLPKAYGQEDPNFDLAIAIAKKKGLNAIWVDEGHNQPDSVFVINPKLPI